MTSPAVKFRSRKLRFLTSFAVCLVLMTIDSSDAQPPKSAKPVTVANTISDTVKTGQTFVGSVIPSRQAVIGSAVDGRVVDFHVDEGDRIKAKAPLAQLLTATISLELKTSKAELEFRKQELEELKQGTRKLELEQMQALMKVAKATSDYTDQNLKRLTTLRERGTITELEYLDAQSKHIAALETYNEAKAIYELAVEGPRKEKIAQAQARVDMQGAIVEKLEDQITKHTIITRFDGYIIQEFTEEGAWVNRGDPVAEVAALDEVDVLANVLESQIRFIRKGDLIRVEIPALPDRVFTGKVESIVPQADLRARTFPVKIRLQNEVSDDVPLIKAGMLARAMLPTGPETKALFVPKDAINLGGETPIVYVVRHKKTKADTGTAAPVSVRLGIANGSLIEVRGELKEGDLVVVRGNERLQPMTEVKITARIDSHDLIEKNPVSATNTSETPGAAETVPASTEKSK